MKTKFKLLSLVLGIALTSVLFTQCVKNEESDGVRAVREGYASKLLADADYQKASAEKIRAEAEKIRLLSQWEAEKLKAEAELAKLENQLKEFDVKIKELEYERDKATNQAEIDAILAELAAQIAQSEADLEEAKNLLLQAQHEHALALINNEAALVAAKQALAEAQANFLANNPNLEKYQDLYNQLFVSPNYYGEKTELLIGKLDKESEIIALKYSSNAERLAWLVRDSVKKAQNLSYAKQLLAKYEALDGQTVEQLQAQADNAEIEWKQALTVVAEKELIRQEKSNVYDTEDTKYGVEYDKLTTLKNKMNTSSVTLLVSDSLYSLNPYNSPAVYPAPVSSLVSSVYSQDLYGYKSILNRATGRLAYLKSELLTSQPTGFGYAATPSDYEPTKKFLEERIKHIEDVLLPAIDRQISEQNAKVSDANSKWSAGRTAWASAETAYKTTVADLNTKTTALRTQLTAWEKAANDSIVESSVEDLTTAQQNAFFAAIKNYYVARYNFDRFVAIAPLVTYIPNTLAGLNDAAAFNAEDFFVAVGANSWGIQLTVINALKNASDIKVVNNYEYKIFDGSSDKPTATTSSANGAIIQPFLFPASTSTVATEYVNSKFGTLLYQSRNVYGASNITDIHYFLPYDTKRPTESANGKTPAFGNYSSSLFAALQTAKDAFTLLVENKANTFYVENYKTVLALVNRTIAYYEGLATEYGALVAETEAAVAAQTEVVNAQLKVREAAYAAYLEADAAVTTATTYAGNLEGIYDLLSDANPSSTLAIIKDKIDDLETEIDGLITDVEEANEALAEYRAKGSGSDVIADKIKALEAEIKDIDAQIKALEAIINSIEAQMAELLK